MAQTGLNKLQDVTADLQNGRIKNSKAQLEIFIDGMKRNINLFDSNLKKECLFNISSGEAAREHVEISCLILKRRETKKREEYTQNCGLNLESRWTKLFSFNSLEEFTSN